MFGSVIDNGRFEPIAAREFRIGMLVLFAANDELPALLQRSRNAVFVSFHGGFGVYWMQVSASFR
jgi:hypothetical protein